MLLQPGWYLTCCIGTANLCAVKSGTEQHPCLLPGGGYLFSVTCLLQEQSFLSCWILPPVGEVDINFSGYITDPKQRFLINQVSPKLYIT